MRGAGTARSAPLVAFAAPRPASRARLARRHHDLVFAGVPAAEKTEDAKTLIELAVERFLEEVPALAPLKLVFAVELRGRGDVQMYRVELPGPEVTKDIASDARVRVEMPRSFFNVMAKEAHIADWREAFTYGQAKATGIDQIMKLIVHVVEKQEERQRTRRARHS